MVASLQTGLTPAGPVEMSFTDKILAMQHKVDHAFETYEFPRHFNKLAIVDLLFTRSQEELDRFLACPEVLLERHINRC